ncbi:NfeD family protein [Kushneria aurantia]|uniref:NfeD family protein n=1 Tax=Kushneria aurantia TaxID=504092 RepID=A0ABV6FZB0_9GAMM|nr:NfeD family protein [Kushneria aurantia]
MRYLPATLLLLLVTAPAFAAPGGALGDGVWLLSLGLVLIAVEAITPIFGVVGLAGLVLFVLGAVLMANAGLLPGGDSFGALALVIVGALVIGTFLLWIVTRALKFRHMTPLGGREALIGATGEVPDDFTQQHLNHYLGYVRVHGERWQAASDCPLSAGDSVRVTTVDGLRLRVERGPCAGE